MAVVPDQKGAHPRLVAVGWSPKRLGDVATFQKGAGLSKADLTPDGIYRCIHYGELFTSYGATIWMLLSGTMYDPGSPRSQANDVLMPTSDVTPSGLATASCIRTPGALLGGDILIIRPDPTALDGEFLAHSIRSNRRQILQLVSGTTVSHLHARDMANFTFLAPEVWEQRAIAAALGDVDALIASLDRLIAKKRDLKQAAIQQLLTGRTRLPGFSGEWRTESIGGLATPSSAKNSAAESLPVLTCSKHLGFVDSLGYFKNQVFSEDTSTYKLIRRGEIGYPANHVEEGSIGLQDIYDVALVSPIYIVFSVSEGVDSYFLHRLLKLDSYRLVFKTATTSSVDRRGSLRWRAFSQIVVKIPPLPEQRAIAAVLADIDAEIDALQRRRDKTRALKQGMMQQLLTGRIRLV